MEVGKPLRIIEVPKPEPVPIPFPILAPAKVPIRRKEGEK